MNPVILNKIRTGFGKLWKLITPISRTLKVLEKKVFSKWLWKVVEFCSEEFLNLYPKMNVLQCLMKHRICNVCPFYHL